ncbi:transposase [uncultured Desulfobacterium sp.]|uniref:Transposase n=1 Tax=uncultured Desulfobacterium sp. TaxID=201089 RepID=A0A445MV77_9BACT|nr:transposase [uncultured Desulfobacterium sp.]
MIRPVEVADIFRAYGPLYRNNHKLPTRHLRAMRAIEICRTAELGGHKYRCDTCGSFTIFYHSCRNRHCPKCQSLDKERWIDARKKEVLPIHYFHVVFTIPEDIRPIALRNQEVSYGILFKSVAQTLKELCKDPKHLGAQIGLISVLHTWSQTLMNQPHVHCIVTGGGLSLDGERWISSKPKFFIHVKVLSQVFRGKFLDYLKQAYEAGKLSFTGKIGELKDKKNFKELLSKLYGQSWHVYCKPPFRAAQKVVEYLNRYSHRVAISNERIVRFGQGRVTIRYRDYADGDKTKEMVLDALEFIRRFLLHILPDQFVKIRYYGILSTRNRSTKLLKCKELFGVPLTETADDQLSWQELFERLTGIDPTLCPHCKKGKLILFEVLGPERSPPL